MSNITLNQAIRNIEILDHHHSTFTADGQGNLSYISWYNIPKRVYQWIKSFFDNSEYYRAYQVVLQTFDTLNRDAESNPSLPTWTYNEVHGFGWDFDIGFDKVAIRLLADNWNFPTHIISRPPTGIDERVLYKIEEAAHVLLRWSSAQRVNWGMNYGDDHLRYSGDGNIPYPLRNQQSISTS